MRDLWVASLALAEVTIDRKISTVGKWPKYHMIPYNNHVASWDRLHFFFSGRNRAYIVSWDMFTVGHCYWKFKCLPSIFSIVAKISQYVSASVAETLWIHWSILNIDSAVDRISDYKIICNQKLCVWFGSVQFTR